MPKSEPDIARRYAEFGGSVFTERFWRRVDKTGECWVWKGNIVPKGYGTVTLYHGKGVKRTCLNAHRAAWILTYGPIQDGLYVLHTCDVRACCNPGHLYLGTQSRNMLGRAERNPGSWARGHQIHRTKLRMTDVMLIHAALKSGMRQQDVAAGAGVSKSCIGAIAVGETWRHVTGLERKPRRRRSSAAKL